MTERKMFSFYLSAPLIQEWRKVLMTEGMVPSRRLEVLIKKDLEELRKEVRG